MRLTTVGELILASSLLVACGGGTPPPKEANEAAEQNSAKPENASAESANSSSKESPAPSQAAEASSPPASTKSSSGDLVAPTADDPWMAAHQMPSTEVLKTMRAAKGKVNACWAAARKRDPSVSGEVKIKFVVTHEGTVRVWRNEDSTCSDGDAITCVGEVIKALKFPTQKSPGDAWGIYQINFGS
jgi:hypothetical protein